MRTGAWCVFGGAVLLACRDRASSADAGAAVVQRSQVAPVEDGDAPDAGSLAAAIPSLAFGHAVVSSRGTRLVLTSTKATCDELGEGPYLSFEIPIGPNGEQRTGIDLSVANFDLGDSKDGGFQGHGVSGVGSMAHIDIADGRVRGRYVAIDSARGVDADAARTGIVRAEGTFDVPICPREQNPVSVGVLPMPSAVHGPLHGTGHGAALPHPVAIHRYGKHPRFSWRFLRRAQPCLPDLDSLPKREATKEWLDASAKLGEDTGFFLSDEVTPVAEGESTLSSWRSVAAYGKDGKQLGATLGWLSFERPHAGDGGMTMRAKLALILFEGAYDKEKPVGDWAGEVEVTACP